MSRHRRRRIHRHKRSEQRAQARWEASGGIDKWLAIMYPNEALKTHARLFMGMPESKAFQAKKEEHQ